MKIKICEICKGEGELQFLEDRHSGYTTEPCTHCGGTGKVYTRTYKYEVPFNMEKSIIYEYDAKIIEMIREFENKYKHNEL